MDFENLDVQRLADRMDLYGMHLLRYGLALVFLWFGGLKLVGGSPATELVAATLGFVPLPSATLVFALGVWEVAIGAAFLFKRLTPVALALFAPQMMGTFMPIVLLPDQVFAGSLLHLTLEGQYIVKNLLLIGAALMVGSRYLSEQYDASAATTRTV